MTDRIQPERTFQTRARATIPQEFFYSMARHDPDPSAYYQTSAFMLEGAIDPTRLERTMRALVEAHEVFRTVLREEAGVLWQVVLPVAEAPRFELELAERALPEAEWNAEIKRTIDELVARGWDLAAGRVLWARLTKLAPDRFAFVVVFHHVVIDAASTYTFFRELFTSYVEGRDVAAPPLQYIDIAEAFTRWSQTETGKAQDAYWQALARDATPIALPTDRPRAPVDERRSAGRRGIATDPMHPVQYVRLPHDLREAVTRLARKQRVTIYGVYATALLWLLHRETGQTDLCIETTSDMRQMHRALADVQGVLVIWTLLRADLAGCTSFRETLARVGKPVAELKDYGPIDDYYGRVPHALRRVILNYVPLRWLAPEPTKFPDLRIEQRGQPFPRWKRPWDLHLTLLDADDAILAWTGNENLFHRETVAALLEKYVAILRDGALG